jgi:hypothetical protein
MAGVDTPRAACGVTPQGAMLADWRSQIGGILDGITACAAQPRKNHE